MQITDGMLTWLGPAAGEMTPEQIEMFAEQWQRVDERYPDPDEQPERHAALSAVVQYLLGETSAEDANRALIDARLREREAYVVAETIAVMMVRHGYPKAGAARAVGIDRMSLLKALGER
ncbi:hypothetical protein [Micromonospora sp. CB01531]|uniref:hypothetical protein n=1 Tax=Micromonospora sp. CB01531 TaxID=1718947 RepID=UPI000B290D28|nr:hypothetical protein [Micromonospora sp. CB01531]